MMKKYVIAILCSCLLLLSACTTALFSAVTTGGVVVAQERSVGNAVDDFAIWTEISHLYLQKHIDDVFAKINIEVIEGRVLLSGVVKEPKSRIDAIRLAWKVDGVKEVINEIEIAENGRSIREFAMDQWIYAQLKGQLLFEKEIRSINYSVEVIRGKVYLIGIARDMNELDRVTDIASRVKNVKKVVSHVRLKDDPERT